MVGALEEIELNGGKSGTEDYIGVTRNPKVVLKLKSGIVGL